MTYVKPGLGQGVQVSGRMVDQALAGKVLTLKSYMDVEVLEVYKRLCQIHMEVCDLTITWPSEEKYELGRQVRRSSNSSPAQLAEKNDDTNTRGWPVNVD